MNELLFNPTNEIGFFIARTHRAMLAQLQIRLNEAGLDITTEQGFLLMKLTFKDGISQQGIADGICKEKSSVKRLIDGMEQRNLIVRVEDKDDRRNKLIYLTYGGRQIGQQVAEIAKGFLAEIYANVDANEIEIFKKVLDQIYHQVNPFVEK